MLTQYSFSVLVAVVFVIFCFEVLRRGYIQEKFAVSWLASSVAALVFAIFPPLVKELSGFLSIKTPINFLFFISITFLAVTNIQLIFEMGKMKQQIQLLAEKLAQSSIRNPSKE